MLVCMHREDGHRGLVAYVLLAVEPERKWKSCLDQMVRAARLMAAIGRWDDVHARFRDQRPSRKAEPPEPAEPPDRTPEIRRSLAAFWRDIVRHFAERTDLDGWDFEEMAEKHGLIERQPFDPEKHGVFIEADEGDIIWMDAVPKDYHG
jgi:hypothetical protein